MANNSPAAHRERLIYIGPNIPGGVLQTYTVFKGGVPEHLKNLLEKCPAVVRLFVPADDLAEARKAVLQKGTPENIFYGQVVDFIKRGGLK